MSAQDISRNLWIIINDAHGDFLLFECTPNRHPPIREGSVCCANVLCQEVVRYWLQECMTLMGFDRSPRGPELSQAGACFRLQGPWVMLLKACTPSCAWMPPNMSFKAAHRGLQGWEICLLSYRSGSRQLNVEPTVYLLITADDSWEVLHLPILMLILVSYTCASLPVMLNWC